jgi:hypothetical protein
MPLPSTIPCYHGDYAYYVPCYCTAVFCSVFETRRGKDEVIRKPLQKSSWNLSRMTSKETQIWGKYQLFTSTSEKRNAKHLMMWDSESVMCWQHASHADAWEEGKEGGTEERETCKCRNHSLVTQYIWSERNIQQNTFSNRPCCRHFYF